MLKSLPKRDVHAPAVADVKARRFANGKEKLQADFAAFRAELEACLRQGSVSQRIETCTDLYFQHSGVTGGKPMREDYFTYGSTTGTDFMPDACGFLSAPVTGSWSSSMLPRVLACQDEQQDLHRISPVSGTPRDRPRRLRAGTSRHSGCGCR
mgnify:CR=1 FL=1